MAKGNGGKRLRARDFNVREEDRPGWERVGDRQPKVGENVYCAGGEGTVISIHGKTGDGSRLLEIRLREEKLPPFFASSSNVLIYPGVVVGAPD